VSPISKSTGLFLNAELALIYGESIQYSDVKSEKNDRKNINAQSSTSAINMYINNAAPTHNIKESMAIKTTPRTPLLAI